MSWTLTDNGVTVQSGTGPDFSFSTGPISDPTVEYIASATVTDASGSGSDSEQIVVSHKWGGGRHHAPGGHRRGGGTQVSSTPIAAGSGVIVQVDGSNDYIDGTRPRATSRSTAMA